MDTPNTEVDKQASDAVITKFKRIGFVTHSTAIGVAPAEIKKRLASYDKQDSRRTGKYEALGKAVRREA